MLFSILLSLAACGPRKGWVRVSGEFDNLPQADLLLYSPDGGLMSIDTLHIVKGRFEYEFRVPDENQHTYVVIYPNFMTLSFMAHEGQDVRVRGDALSLGNEVVEGADSVIPPVKHQSKPLLKVGGRLPKNDIIHHRRGTYLLINFGAEWRHGNSSVYFTTRQALERHKDSLYAFTYSLDVDPAQERRALDAPDTTRWHYHCDSRGWSSPLVIRLGIRNIPYHILLGPNGRILALGNDYNRDIKQKVDSIGP